MSRISIIAALGAKSRAIGRQGQLLWQIPEDMRRFKELTSGHPVIMGGNTWNSLPPKYRPLPGRTNIVIAREPDFPESPGMQLARTIGGALTIAADSPGSDEIFVIGGGQIYAATLSHADRLYLTLVDDDAEGDTFFPAYEDAFKIVKEETGAGLPPHRFLILERK